MLKRSLYLITGNAKKLQEFKQILGDKFDFNNENVDLPEIQGEPEEVAKQKVRIAYNKTKKAVIVEDTSLCFNAYKGLPGPYIKWFLKAVGCEGLAKMVQPFEDKTGSAVCILAYMGPELTQPKLFIGKTPGKIVEPRGSRDFGWDPNFQPEGFDKTYAELPKEIKNTISHRYRAIKEMEKYFDERSHEMKDQKQKNVQQEQKASLSQPKTDKKEEKSQKKNEKSSKKDQKTQKKEQKSSKKEEVQGKHEENSGKRQTRSVNKSSKKEESITPKKDQKKQKSGAKSKGK